MKKIPYYKPAKSVHMQIKESSIKRNQNIFIFLIKKMKNYILERIAINNPVNNYRIICHRYRGVNIGNGVMIGMGCVLDHAFPEYITLEDNTALAGNVYIICHSNPYYHLKDRLLSYVAPVTIKEGAWLGVNVTVLPGVSIGENSIISAGTVVKNDIPSDVVVAGNPAKIIKKFSPYE